MIIALASPRAATSIEDGLQKVEQCLSSAAAQGAEIVCFPEAYLPGLRGLDFDVPAFDAASHERVLKTAAALSRKYAIATIIGTERVVQAGRQIVSHVFDSSGQHLGSQTKNQIDPSEDPYYVPGTARRMFEIVGVKFGIVICHEGWRYPETVRWAAVRGARIVFHPQHTGHDREGVCPTQWGAMDGAYYEQAMMMRSRENTIYFASVNYALKYPESATSVIDPSGECIAYLPYGEEGVLVHEIDVEKATGLLAYRFAPERYESSAPARQAAPNERTTKMETFPEPTASNDELQPEYDFRKMCGVVRGKYTARYEERLRVVRLADDVASSFTDEAAVNAALREYLKNLPPTATTAS